MATNAGPCLNKDRGEPDGDKIPLIDRCHSHMVFAQECVDPLTDEEWHASLALPQNRIKLVKYRLVSCLTCVILMLLKHSPWLVPDLAYAKAVCSRLDRIVESRFNLPRPSPRKIGKRNFTLLHLTVESAVASLLWSVEGIKASMPCLDQPHLVPFEPSQIVGIVESLQRHATIEVILNAYSHSLTFSMGTSLHALNTRVVLAQLVGASLDHRTISKYQTNKRASGGPGDAEPQAKRTRCAGQFPEDAMYGTRPEHDLVSPKAADGRSVMTTLEVIGLMDNGLTRSSAATMADRMADRRVVKGTLSQALAGKRTLDLEAVTKPIQALASVIETLKLPPPPPRMGLEEQLLMDSFGTSAELLPTHEDWLRAGHSLQFIESLVDETHGVVRDCKLPVLGVTTTGWEYKRLGCSSSDVDNSGPAAYNMQLAVILPTGGRAKDGAAEASLTGANAGDGKTAWGPAAGLCIAEARSRSSVFDLFSVSGMTFEIVRDTLFLLSVNRPENSVRVASRCPAAAAHAIAPMQCEGTDLPTIGGECGPLTPVHPRGLRSRDACHVDAYNATAERVRDVPVVGDSDSVDNAYSALDRYLGFGAIPTLQPAFAYHAKPVLCLNDGLLELSLSAAREIADLYTEAAVFCSTLPGVFGQHTNNELPPSFVARGARNRVAAVGAPEPHEVDTQSGPVEGCGDAVRHPGSSSSMDGVRLGAGLAGKARLLEPQLERLWRGYDLIHIYITARLAELFSRDSRGYVKRAVGEEGYRATPFLELITRFSGANSSFPISLAVSESTAEFEPVRLAGSSHSDASTSAALDLLSGGNSSAALSKRRTKSAFEQLDDDDNLFSRHTYLDFSRRASFMRLEYDDPRLVDEGVGLRLHQEASPDCPLRRFTYRGRESCDVNIAGGQEDDAGAMDSDDDDDLLPSI